jgi:7-cyano-7-deazaguanine synthase
MSTPTTLAVLTSGGLDSAILLADLAKHCQQVHPVYVRAGLFWETAELAHLRRFLPALSASVRPLVVLDMPVADLYGRHWSVTGQGVPDATTPDEAVYMPGRNLLLLAKALLWCQAHQVPALALATLANNPFPDATETFFRQLSDAVNQAVGGSLRILCPYGNLHKTEVLERGEGLPLQWTFSCLRPSNGIHCGACNKCAERRTAFAELGWQDVTEYAAH